MAKNKPNLVFFTGVYPPHLGGVERYTYELATRLTDDYNVFVITSNTENLPLEKNENGVKVFRLPIKNLPKKNRLPFLKHDKNYQKILSELRVLKIDHIICQTRFYETTFLGLNLAKEKNITPIIIDHSGDYIIKPYERFLISKIKKYRPTFYSVSKANQEFLKKEFNINSKIILYNSIAKSPAPKKPKHKKTKIIFAGRIMKEKGIEVLLQVFKKLQAKYQIELEILGDGKIRQKLQKKYQNVKFSGKIAHEKVLEEFETADILVFPSLYPEGFPSVLLEAGMKKCAIIATNWPAMGELVGDAGILIDRKAKNLDEVLVEVLEHPQKMKNLQDKIYTRVSKNFTWDKTVEKLKRELKNEK